MATALPELLQATPLSGLLVQRSRGDRGLVAFSEGATVGHALQRLLAEGLRTAPVVAADTVAAAANGVPDGSDWTGPFPAGAMRGFVEAPAIIELLMTGLPDLAWPPTPDELEAAGAQLCSVPLSSVLRPPPDGGCSGGATAGLKRSAGGSGVGPCAWPAIELGASVLDAVAIFLQTHAQHLLVLGPGPSVESVVSQSDIVKFLATNLPSAGDLSTRTLASLGLAGRALAGSGRHIAVERHSALARGSLGPGRGAIAASSGWAGAGGSDSGSSTSSRESSPAPCSGRAVGWRLATVPDSATALDAFRVMHARGVSGVAVIGRCGELAGHLGASDVRWLAPGLFHELLAPLRDFLAHLPRAPSGASAQATSAGRVLCAQPTSSLGTLVAALVRQRVHRIYISDSDGAPVGVVTCTDVLNLLRQVHGRA